MVCIALTVAACAVMVSSDAPESDVPDADILGGSPGQSDTPEEQVAVKYGGSIPITRESASTVNLKDCVITANGLVFSFTNPYIPSRGSTEYGLNLDGNDYRDRGNVYGTFNYSVDYGSGEQVITFTDGDVRDKKAPEVPLVWICDFIPPDDQSDVLDIPAVIRYGDSEYFVYGCLDGYDIWNNRSFFGKNTRLTATTVNFHIAYDHYVVPSVFFRQNPHVTVCSMEYIPRDITWYQTTDAEGELLDEPVPHEFHSEGYISYIGDMAFYQNKSVRKLDLPDRIACMGYNCFSAMGLTEFTFDTSVRSFQSIPAKALGGGYCFSGNTTLEILTIGKNVDNLPSNLFSKFTYPDKETCNTNSDNLRIVYNAGSRVTQAAVTDSITESGSVAKHHVYLFNLFGGDLEVPATLGTQYLTMPTVCVRDGVNEAYIPAWRVNETAEKVLTGGRVEVNNSTKVLSVYNGISIATYHLGDTVLGIQDLVCDYASEARYGDSFPGLSDVFLLTHWNTSPDGTGTTYVPGQTIVTVTNLDLYAQGIPLRNEFTVTYLYSEHVDDDWYDVTATGTYTNGDNNRYATGADGLTVVSRTEGRSHAALGGFTHWCLVPQTNDRPSGDIYFQKGDAIDTAEDVTLRAVSENSAVMYSIKYTDGSENHVSVFWSSSQTPSVVLEQVMFANGSRPFDCWRDQATGETHRAGDTVTLAGQRPNIVLETVWRSGTTDILFNYGVGTGTTERQRDVPLWEEVDLKTPSWIRTGYSFLGWSDSPGVGYPSYAPGMTVVISDTMLVPDPENPERRVFNLHAVWEAELAGHVVIVMHDSVAVYDNRNHAVQSGYTVLGLDDMHTVSLDYVRCDSEGAYMHTQGLNVKNVGVYYYTAEVAIINKVTKENETVRYAVHKTVGFLTIIRNTDYSSVVIEGRYVAPGS